MDFRHEQAEADQTDQGQNAKEDKGHAVPQRVRHKTSHKIANIMPDFMAA